MKKIVKLDETENVNLPNGTTYIYVGQFSKAKYVALTDWKGAVSIHWKSYQIKESDFRIKTASFVSPQKLDLTNGQYYVLISSPYHENFAGIILTSEYNEDNGLYTYKCQDWSRKHMSKRDIVMNGTARTWDLIVNLITENGTSLPVPTQKQLDIYTYELSGLRPASEYLDKDWGGVTNINPMTQQQQMIIRNTSAIEAIRDLLLPYYIDVYFNDCGILQIEPYHKDDFFNTGLHLEKVETTNRQYKFDITNVVTGVIVENSDKTVAGNWYGNSVLIDFFGYYTSEIGASETPSASSSGSSSNNTNGNPYGTKAKKVWINADNGSNSMKNSIANLLKQHGWDVHVGGTCSNCHYEDYWNVTSDYQVYATLYNGFCAGTVREAYSDKIQNALRNKGVVLVIMWDTSDWTNPQGMGPYRYGDFTGYSASRAWDDNFSNGDPSIQNVSQWLKSKDAKYCASPTAEGIVEQFLAGGYFKYAGK